MSKKKANFGERLYMGLIFVFMYAPIVTLIVLSFNSSKSRARWGGFTFQWYLNLFGDSAVINALANTLIIALISTVVATIIGTVTCVALMGVGRKSRAVIMGITNIPMINADIVTGISLMLIFVMTVSLMTPAFALGAQVRRAEGRGRAVRAPGRAAHEPH